ncbi:MAG: ATP-binding protein [Pseudonocardiales bacterium]|nr:ATP-binding protein [Pseudonocardiales bacterium]MBV9728208.1 ATP-binding protein [Pseudonocardiales bacterium]
MALMGSGEQAYPSTSGDGERQNRRIVVMQVRARASQLSPLRLVVADLAARADFDLDTVADLRLAVDEAVSELVAIAVPEAMLICTFRLDAGQMEVSSSVPAKPGANVRRDSFGWRVLTTLVDEVRVTNEPESDPSIVGITLLKRRRDETVAQRR